MKNWKMVFFFFTLASLLRSIPAAAEDVVPQQVYQQENNVLFYPATTVDMANDSSILQARPVYVDQYLLTSQANVVLNLLDTISVTARRERIEYLPETENSFIWYGAISGDPESEVTFSAVNGVVIGNIQFQGAFYQLRYLSDRIHVIYEVAPTAFPDEMEPIIPNISASAPVSPTTLMDNGSVVDVLVVYTGDARSAAGGTSAMQALINLAVAETNTGYNNSGINFDMNLVHTAEVNYSESGFNWNTALDRLTNPSDGYMDEVHTLRDAYYADIVTLIVNNTSVCGIGWVMSYPSTDFASYAFNIVARPCATGYYSFAHEIGHNMGSAHDRATGCDGGSYSYSCGYQAPNRAFRTIMAYNCSGGCPRLNYWSNPNVLYGGQAMGIANDADNHRSLNENGYIVTNFRKRGVLPPYQNLIRNGTFTAGINEWWTWGELDWAIYNDILHFKRRASSPNGAAIGQDIFYSIPPNTPFEIELKLGNTSGVTKFPAVFLRAPNHWDGAIQCWFTIPPNTPLQTYRIRARSNNSEWAGLKLEVWPDPPDGMPDVSMDDVSIQYRPDLNPSGTECLLPNMPPQQPTLVSPGDGATLFSRTVDLGWSPGADDGIPNPSPDYWIQVDDNSDFSSPVAQTGWLYWETVWQVTLPADGLYYWRVNQGDSQLNSGWTPARTFYIDSTYPSGKITEPQHNTTTNVSPLTISAEANSANGIQQVKFYAWYCHNDVCDWRYLGEDTAYPYSISWDWSDIGDKRVWLSIDIYSNNGRITSSAGGWVEVDLDKTEPSVNFIYPKEGMRHHYNQIELSVDVQDNLATGARVQFFVGYTEPTTNVLTVSNTLAPEPAVVAGAGINQANDYWKEIGWDEDGSNGWQIFWNAVNIPDGTPVSFFVYVYDKAMNYHGEAIWNNLVDRSSACASCGLRNSPWPGYRHDLTHTGRTTLNAPDQPVMVWSGMFGEAGSEAVIDENGNIYYGFDNTLIARNAQGTVLWKYPTAGRVKKPLLAANGRLYVGADNGDFYALDTDGKWYWTFHTQDWINSSATIDKNGTIYIGSSDGYLYALRPDGSLKWRYRTGSWMNSSPAVDENGIIYVGSTTSKIYAINQDGTLKWDYTTGSYIDASPALGQDGVVYIGSIDSYLYAFNPNGSLKWRYKTDDAIYASPALGVGGVIYIGSSDDYLYALNSDGSLRWRFKADGDVHSPVIDGRGNIYFSSHDGKIYALNANGSQLWQYILGGWLQYGPLIGQNGALYVTDIYGRIYAFGNTAVCELCQPLTDSWSMHRTNLKRTGYTPYSGPQNLTPYWNYFDFKIFLNLFFVVFIYILVILYI